MRLAQDENDIRPDLANLANGSDSARDSLVDDYRLDLPVRGQSRNLGYGCLLLLHEVIGIGPVQYEPRILLYDGLSATVFIFTLRDGSCNHADLEISGPNRDTGKS
jgi:hypothetical protein